MAVSNASGNAQLLNLIRSYANEKILSERHSTMFKRAPLLTYLAGRSKSENALGRPGTLGLVGGSGNFSQVEVSRESAIGVHDRLHAKVTEGGKWMTLRDNMPSAGANGQDMNNISAVHRYARFTQPIKIWNATKLFSRGAEKIADAVREGIDEAIDVASDNLIPKLWYGNPTDQSADQWDSPLGVTQAMKTGNTYGNVNRSTHSFFNGKRVTSAKTIGLNLIDDANLTQGAAVKGGGVDLVLMSPALYNGIKQEALSRGQNLIVTDMPEAAEVGIKYECIKYGRATITFDPFLSGNWAAHDSDITDASKVVAMFNTEDWIFSTHPEGNWSVDEFFDQSKIEGGSDAITSNVNVMPRLRCVKPERSVLYTNVTVGS